MESRIQKWGNSLAVRIPKAFAEETLLSEDATVEITVQEGALVIVATRKRRISLEKLLRGITRENIHGEVTTGEQVGNEAW
jgi:antitoxin MazE